MYQSVCNSVRQVRVVRPRRVLDTGADVDCGARPQSASQHGEEQTTLRRLMHIALSALVSLLSAAPAFAGFSQNHNETFLVDDK